jgi:hypothetical protein
LTLSATWRRLTKPDSDLSVTGKGTERSVPFI